MWSKFLRAVRNLGPSLGIEIAAGLIVAAIVAGAFGELWLWITLAGVAGAVATWAGFEIERLKRASIGATVPVVRARGGRVFTGMDIGRTQMSYGVLEVTTDDRTRLPARARELEIMHSAYAASPIDPDQGKPIAQIFDDLADKVVSLMQHAPRGIDGFGFGVPGQVNPATGEVHSPGALGTHRNFVDAMTTRLARHDLVLAALGHDKPAAAQDAEREQFVADRLFVDNDVRCATRAVLSRRRNDSAWRDFACIFIGTGVGAGYVLQGSVFYGAGFTAGEVGHMTVHLSPGQHSLREEPPGLSHLAKTCECGRQGVHWESLVSGPGLEHLAHELDEHRSALLAKTFKAPTRGGGIAAPQLSLVAELLEGRGPSAPALDAVDRSIGAACMRRDDDHPHTAASVLADVEAVISADPGMEDYVSEVLQTHARYFTVGVENLVNVLNVSHLTLGGGVMDGLWPLEIYKRAWNNQRGDYALESAMAALELVEHEPELRPGFAWTGSALLFRDPSYIAAREGRPFGYGLVGR